MTYQLNKEKTSLIRLEDGANIPLVFGNRDFNEAYEILHEAGLVTVVNDVFTFVVDDELLTEIPGPSILEVKQDLTNKIDEASGELRGKYITTAKGQESTYAEKSVEFELYLAKGQPTEFTQDVLGIGYYSDEDGRKYYYVAAEVTALGFDPASATAEEIQAAVNNVLHTKAAWTQINAAIESLRLGGKILVKNSTTVEEANEKANEIFTKLLALGNLQ